SGATNLLDALTTTINDSKAEFSATSRKQLVFIFSDGSPTNQAGLTDAQVKAQNPGMVIDAKDTTVYRCLDVIAKQAKSQVNDDDFTLVFIQLTSEPETFKNFCKEKGYWDQPAPEGSKNPTHVIYEEILAASAFLKVADDHMSETFGDSTLFDIVDVLKVTDLLDESGNIKPIQNLMAKVIND
ncbi:MAG: hypothetical protein ACRCXZ_08700, partial [Patescibacteria group bacterium]